MDNLHDFILRLTLKIQLKKKDTVIKTLWYCLKDGHIDQWSRRENESQMYSYTWSFQQKVLDSHTERKKNSFLPCAKINLKCTTGPNRNIKI